MVKQKRSILEMQIDALKVIQSHPKGICISKLIAKTNMNAITFKEIIQEFIDKKIINVVPNNTFRIKTLNKSNSLYILPEPAKPFVYNALKKYDEALNYLKTTSFS